MLGRIHYHLSFLNSQHNFNNLEQWRLKRALTSILLEQKNKSPIGLRLTPFPTRLHHHPTTDSVKGVGHQPRDRRHSLGDHPAHDNVHILGVRQHPCGKSQETKWPWHGSSEQLSKKQVGMENRPPHLQLHALPFQKSPPFVGCFMSNQAANKSWWHTPWILKARELCPVHRACWSGSKLNLVTDRGSWAPTSSVPAQ